MERIRDHGGGGHALGHQTRVHCQTVEHHQGDAVGDQAGQGDAEGVDDVGASGPFNTEGFQNAADHRAHDADAGGILGGEERASGTQHSAHDLCLSRILAVLDGKVDHHIEGTAALGGLHDHEQQQAERNDIQHARHTGDDGTGRGEHLIRGDKAEDKIQNNAGKVTDQQRGGQISQNERQNDHGDGEDQHDQGAGIHGIDDQALAGSGRGLETEEDIQDRCDAASDQGIGKTGHHAVSDLCLIGQSGDNGRIGNGSQIVAEIGAGDDGAHDQGGVAAQAYREGEHDGRHGADGAAAGAAGGGDQDRRQEDDNGDEAYVEVHFRRQPEQAVDQAALPQDLGKNARQEEGQYDGGKQGITDGIHAHVVEFFLVFTQDKADAKT